MSNPYSEKPPIMVFKDAGQSGDDIDALDLVESFEHPGRWEDTIRNAHSQAKTDEDLDYLLKQIYLQEDRAEAFEDFATSDLAANIAAFISRFGINPQNALCDLGCGPGRLAYALHRLGFINMTAMDPNSEWNTGTGYLKSIARGQIDIINDLSEWRKVESRFDAVVSQGTIHHWDHIPLVSIDVRRAMKPGAFWFAFSEYFASKPREFVDAIKFHPTASRYGSYEWAYPASVYVDLIQSVGFQLVSVVPYFYRNNALSETMRPVPDGIDIEVLNQKVDDGLVTLHGTTEMFWDEVDQFRRQDHGNRIFTEPQVLVFQRIGA